MNNRKILAAAALVLTAHSASANCFKHSHDLPGVVSQLWRHTHDYPISRSVVPQLTINGLQHQFDAKGRRLRVTEFRSDWQFKFEPSVAGKPGKLAAINHKQRQPKWATVSIEETKGFVPATSKTLADLDGLDLFFTYQKNDDGSCIVRRHQVKQMITQAYTLDARGELVNLKMYLAGQLVNVDTTYKRNAKGQLIATYVKDRLENEFDRVYDQHGNWTLSRERHRGNTAFGISTRLREVSY